ncbi:Piso0_001623 [Millerozyma farinosa CBS 7064]|uniref:Translocation protein SEC62 n=1 Tax=Pichia sorbitophila (strain ATCC MYA-4447 / BCRC 22081 / CBS 7064 / NBRC 10061 / NRRL Y-12695) TaxID=559304 RepID=G8YLA3_PICSO|nr:Piso0_001623 [Millerozyma farinosa CBS 7064]
MADRNQGVPVSTSGERSPETINVANFLRDNKILKQRTGLLNNSEDVEFFRYKRIVRALLSDEYKKKQANPKAGLIPVSDEQDATKVFISLIQSQMVIPVQKLHFHEIKQTNKSWKPNRQKPTLKNITKANLEPDSYFAWTYAKPNPFVVLYSILLLVGVFAVILFPLWPDFMKIGVWYISIAMLGLLGLFFLVAIVRLIIYIISLVIFPKPFWLYPNLFEDCGVIESFKPLYAWEEPKKPKKGKKSAKKAAESSSTEPLSNTNAAASSGAEKTDGNVSKRKVVLEEVED